MPSPSAKPESSSSFARVRDFMLHECGIVLRSDQLYLLESRLGPIAQQMRFRHLDAYVDAALNGPPGNPLLMRLVDAMTTHETSFFRDAPFWSTLEKVILPRLFQAQGPRPLRIWSAACAHGQEAYSIAMLLEESWPDVAALSTIVGTDVSELSIERASSATFTELEVSRGLSEVRVKRHFVTENGATRVAPKLRPRVTWEVGNLVGPPGSSPMRAGKDFDIVLCRNVLIYFDMPNRSRALSRLLAAAGPSAYIGLGSTEVLRGLAISPGWYPSRPLPTIA